MAVVNQQQPGLYGDLLYRGGELVVVRSLIGSVIGPDWTADVTAHGFLMFLNAVLDPATQQIYASGKANAGSNVVIVGPNDFKRVIPGGYGNYPSQLAVVEGQVVCYVVLSLTEYGIYDLAGTLLDKFPIPDQYLGTSQGIRFVADDGSVCWGDQTMAGIFEGLVIREWMQRGGYTGGQGQDGGFGLSGNGVSTLYPSGNTFFPRIAVNGPQLALLYVNNAMVCWDALTLPLEVAQPWPLPPPKISVSSYDPLLKAAEPWHLEFTNVGDGTRFIVTKDVRDRLWIEAENAAGHDRTGTVRQLTIEGPDPEPEPEPEPPPMLRRYWFQPNIGSKDLLDLFNDPQRLAHVDVFGLYVQEILTDVSTPQLGTNIYPNLVDADVFGQLAHLGIPLAIELGAVKPGDCHAQSNISGMQTALQRVHDAGGVVGYLTMDEPLTANQQACGGNLEACADAVASFIQSVAAIDDTIQVGWIEAWPEVSYADQVLFLSLLESRHALPRHWHLDIDWNRAAHEHKDPATFIHQCQSLADSYGIVLGVQVNSTVDPIATDAAHYTNLQALATKLHGILPDAQRVIVQSWATRTGGTQDVPNNLGASGLLNSFSVVRPMFDHSPEPEPPPEDSVMLSTYADPAKGVIAVKAVKPIAGTKLVTLISPNDKVVSCQPNGTLEERDPGTEGAYEQCQVGANVATFQPISGAYHSHPFVEVGGFE